MNQIQVLCKQKSGQVKGVYRLRRPRREMTKNGRPYMAMELEDMTVRIPMKVASHSNAKLPLVPRQGCQLSERSDAGVFVLRQVFERVKL